MRNLLKKSFDKSAYVIAEGKYHKTEKQHHSYHLGGSQELVARFLPCNHFIQSE